MSGYFIPFRGGSMPPGSRAIYRVTKGQMLAGKIIGDIAASAGSIGTTELATNAVTTVKITAKAVTNAKRSYGWGAITNTTASVTVATLPVANGGYLLTNVGSSKGVVVTSTGTKLSIPTAGDFYHFVVNATPGATRQIDIKSTAATFNAAGNKVIGLGDVGNTCRIEALSSVRWVVTENSSGVTFAATT